MESVARPEVGNLYQRYDTGESFQVVSVDANSATVQIQSFDGQLDRIGAAEWQKLPLAAAAHEQGTAPADGD